MKRFLPLILVLFLFFEARAQIKLDTLSNYPVGPGVVYSKISAPSFPLNIFLLTVDLKNPFVKMESIKANETLKAREVVSSMAKRRDYANHSVVGAINADFFSLDTGEPINIQIENGEILRNPGIQSTIGFDVNNNPMLNIVKFSGKVFAKDTLVTISGINSTRNTNQMILFNSYNGANTGTNAYGSEAVIHPLKDWMVNDTVTCIVDSIVYGVGKMPLTPGSAVLSGHGLSDTFLRTKLAKGDTIKVYQGITPGLPKLRELLGGLPKIVYNGTDYVDKGYAEEYAPSHTYTREPRTGVGFSKDSTKLYIYVVDGRNPGTTVGVTLKEFAQIMMQTGVYNGLNFDGGGSSEMVVRNSIMNVPSDGVERGVANGMLVVSTAPKEDLSQVILTLHNKQVFRGDKVRFSAIGADKYYNPVALDQSKVAFSCDAAIGTIDNTGLFTAGNLAKGSGYVYLKYNNYTDSARIAFKAITQLILSPDKIVTDTNKTVGFRLRAIDAGNVEQTVGLSELNWTLSDPTVGTVDKSGNFKGKKEGITRLIGEYSGAKDTIEIKVEIGKDVKYIDEMESLTTWSLSGTGIDMQNSKLSVSNDLKSSGKGSLKVDYKFTFDGATASKVYLDANPPIQVYGIPDTLIVDAKSDSASHRVYIIVSDDNGELFRGYSNKYMNSIDRFDPVTVPVKSFADMGVGSFFSYPVSISRIEIQLGSKRVIGTTYSGTVYLDNLRAKYPLTVTSVESEMKVVDGYGLSQNYPNPFNPSTVIE
ncbi:MAG: phosphodiester glycosidase family protein, partial [Ignavibacteriales bacterium]